jgi:hypothetical protein
MVCSRVMYPEDEGGGRDWTAKLDTDRNGERDGKRKEKEKEKGKETKERSNRVGDGSFRERTCVQAVENDNLSSLRGDVEATIAATFCIVQERPGVTRHRKHGLALRRADLIRGHQDLLDYFRFLISRMGKKGVLWFWVWD